jgi:hypothetical protein
VKKCLVSCLLAAWLCSTPLGRGVTLFGYGTRVRVERGHLILEDGIGTDRRYARFARVGHGLERLVVIGSDGMVSFAALRWRADQEAAFVMLERDGPRGQKLSRRARKERGYNQQDREGSLSVEEGFRHRGMSQAIPSWFWSHL